MLPAGSGDQHPLSGDKLTNGLAVKFRGFTSQQVGNGDIPNGQLFATRQQAVGCWDHLDTDAGAGENPGQLADHVAGDGLGISTKSARRLRARRVQSVASTPASDNGKTGTPAIRGVATVGGMVDESDDPNRPAC
ncbi:MAG: hypothetical protein CM1200mP2_08430 [Planctomycetaceae bacterium]|nr:MAG: hypothetical protein CM1200mP2_08430 [Planctomycetaceae bacterium]